MNASLPVAIIGAGPVGLAAAAELAERGLPFVIFEAGDRAGAAMAAWRHVRLFSPWTYVLAPAAGRLLAATGWSPPPGEALPTGGDIVDGYLAPLAAHPAIAPHLRLSTRVEALSRQGADKLHDAGDQPDGRAGRPFVVRWRTAGGGDGLTLARAVIDASGTWEQPNPMGTDGLPVPGERQAAAAGRLVHGLPDVAADPGYAGARTLVVGGGHSAMNVVLDLLALRAAAPATRVLWALRHDRLDKVEAGGLNDQLPARGALGLAARQAVDDGALELRAPFAAEAIRLLPAGLEVAGLEVAGLEVAGLEVVGRQGNTPVTLTVDRVVVATGFRPDLALLRELRLGLDPAVEAPAALAPLIDPNLHSCGSVPPHGVGELSHPEPGLFIAGMKSYGRAPTFLMATGYEQVRSIVAHLAGDEAAARAVHLVLPETGVCSAPPALLAAAQGGGACCGGARP